MTAQEHLFTMAEVAELMGGVSDRYVQALIKRGELGSVRVGRRVFIRPEQYAAFVDAHTIDPDGDS